MPRFARLAIIPPAATGSNCSHNIPPAIAPDNVGCQHDAPYTHAVLPGRLVPVGLQPACWRYHGMHVQLPRRSLGLRFVERLLVCCSPGRTAAAHTDADLVASAHSSRSCAVLTPPGLVTTPGRAAACLPVCLVTRFCMNTPYADAAAHFWFARCALRSGAGRAAYRTTTVSSSITPGYNICSLYLPAV